MVLNLRPSLGTSCSHPKDRAIAQEEPKQLLRSATSNSIFSAQVPGFRLVDAKGCSDWRFWRSWNMVGLLYFSTLPILLGVERKPESYEYWGIGAANEVANIEEMLIFWEDFGNISSTAWDLVLYVTAKHLEEIPDCLQGDRMGKTSYGMDVESTPRWGSRPVQG